MSEQVDADGDADTVTFRVGAEHFKVLERVVRARPETLLCTLLDDPARKAKSEPIFVDADPKRFRYILDWYRYGSIRIPGSMGMLEMKKELAFYQLPEDVKVARDSLAADAIGLRQSQAQAREDLLRSAKALRHKAIGSEIASMLCSQDLTRGLPTVDIHYVKAHANGLRVSGFEKVDGNAVHAAVQTIVGALGFTVMFSDFGSYARFYLEAVGAKD
mmetsp:Transcript_38647/g.86899  ORF Transcript_38647/g.86899 Transcript_38647/m.86899 type:complete len:217 (-) Transcript_38647:12-662(-)